MQVLLEKAIIPSPLNYIGGKFKLLSQILPLFPNVNGTFIDLFCGGCNVGINVDADRVVLNDIDMNLLYLYNTFRNMEKDVLLKMIEGIIEKYSLSRSDIYGYEYYGCESSKGLGAFNKDNFLRLREDFNKYKHHDYYYYAMLYVLIVYSFNNQIRFNSNGEFNLPVGKRDYNTKMQDKLSDFIDRLKEGNFVISSIDFEQFDLEGYGENDFIYADPPYLITCATYNEQDGWNKDREKALYSFLDKADKQRIRFALSNVLRSKGKENQMLIDWTDSNSKYRVIPLNYSYSNSNYQTKDKTSVSEEVLIVNY
ncbi:MAG: DNA adenine methylase [Lachnospiraceae bacterium]|nr:DNA adenine methylase [Lachnospiraceae bacterium]